MSISEEREIRKLQLVAGSTYVVSLPKKWIDQLHLKASDNIVLIKNANKSLTIFQADSEKTRTHHAVTYVSKNESNESLKRRIISMYLAGYSTIEIGTKGIKIQPSHISTIRDLVRASLVGTEVVESSTDTIMIQVLTKIPHLSFDVALKRMYVTASNIHKESIDALKIPDVKYAEEITKMDDEVDRFSLYLMRSLNLALSDAQVLLNSGIEKPIDCLGYRTVVRCVERIADHGVLIAKKIKYLQSPIAEKIMKDIENLSKEALDVFEEAIKALSERNYASAENVATKTSVIVEKEKRLMDKLKNTEENATIIKFILEDIRRTAEYSSDIAEVAMDENVQNVITEK